MALVRVESIYSNGELSSQKHPGSYVLEPSAKAGVMRMLGQYFAQENMLRGDMVIDFQRIIGQQNLFYVFKGKNDTADTCVI